MKRSKKIFVAIGALFIIGVCLITYDIFTRTSLPGSRKYLKETILPSDGKTEDKKNSTQSPSDSTEIINSGKR